MRQNANNLPEQDNLHPFSIQPTADNKWCIRDLAHGNGKVSIDFDTYAAANIVATTLKAESEAGKPSSQKEARVTYGY